MACACGLTGSIIIEMDSGGERHSKPQRRQGPSALFSIEVLEQNATASLGIDIWHKNESETTWTQLGAFTSVSRVGLYAKYLTGFKELYCWRYRVDALGDPGRYLVGSPHVQWFQ